jgi:Xaa-Pro dipeptidase
MMESKAAESMARLSRLQRLLIEKNIQLAVLNRNTDIYYYTGSIQPLYLVVPAESEPFVLARKALNRIQKEASHLKLEAFDNTHDLKQIVQRRDLAGAKRLGFTLDTTAYATVIRWQQFFAQPEIFDLSWEIRLLRMIKSEPEIKIMARAGEIMAGMPRLIQSVFKPGTTELELSAAIEHYFRVNGHSALNRCRLEGVEMNLGVCSGGSNALTGTKFYGVCAGMGLSAAVPYGATYDPIARNSPVHLDYAFNLDGYHVDQTRMFCWGRPSDAVQKAYQVLLQIEQAIIRELKPGILWCDVYEQALKLAVKLGYEAEFMGLGAEKVKFVGHGLGLELDEPPFLAPKMEYRLEAGMTVAVEPKVSLPGVGVVGIEDTFVITDTGCERLTKCSQEFIIVD